MFDVDVYKYDRYNLVDSQKFAVRITQETAEFTVLLTKEQLNQLAKQIYITLEEGN
jgi:hypothetical protein